MAEPTPILLMGRELGLGGTERQLTETARFLPRDLFTPHVGCFVSRGVRRDDLDAAGVPVLQIPVTSFKSSSAVAGARLLRSYIFENRIRIVHAFDAPMNIFGVPVARLSRVPVVISSQRGRRELAGRTYTCLLRVTDRMVDAIVVNCEAMREHLIRDEHVDPGLIRLCHNGIDTTTYRPSDGASAGYDRPLTVGIVCALRPEKGVDILLRAFATVRPTGARLVIVGSGRSEAELKKLASDLRLGDACHFEPGTRAVASWLHKIDIFVLPSRSEALSNSLMEAMACGVCCVASRVGGNPELIQHGRTGLLFENGNHADLASCLRLAITNDRLRHELASNALDIIRTRFSVEAASRTMAGIYESLLDPIRQRNTSDSRAMLRLRS